MESDFKNNHRDQPVVSGDESRFKFRKRTKLYRVEDALQAVNDLAKLAEIPNKSLPYGHRGWIAKDEQDRVPIPKEKLKRYSRGEGLNIKNIRDKKLINKEDEVKFAIEQSARTEILLTEESGYLETDDGETSTQFTQKQIGNSVDISSASKHFELCLEDFGPYRINYTRNGRHLLLGGRKGHIAAFDWITKRPACEINVMEEIFDVQWLHNELMFAVAQKKWVYIYDNRGVELHCLKMLNDVLRLDFLPYHFLLTCCSSKGHLSWLDVSIGQLVASLPVHKGRLNLMTHNPYNGVVCLGHAEGTVTMWSPNSKDYLAKMLCHNLPLEAIAINRNGMYMATSAVNRSMRIWDLRQLKGPLQHYMMRSVASNLAFSDKSLLAVSLGNFVEVYRDCCASTANHAYLRHRVNRTIVDIQFCPYEDVLGVGSGSGFSSVIIPGAGEPHFDALESNPYQSRRHRQEAEVKSLLEKIQPDLISLDPYSIGDVNVPTLEEKLEAKKKLMIGKAPKVDFTPRRRKGKLKGTVHATHVKQIVKETTRKEFVKAVKGLNVKMKPEEEEPLEKKPPSVLDRFLPKKKK